MQHTAAPTLVDAIFPRLESDSRAAALARDLALMLGFALFVALMAQIVVRVPWTTVPITGQTFAVLVAGGALGAYRGAGSIGLYILMGSIGLPVFAAGSSVTAGTWDLHFVLPWSGNDFLLWHASNGGYILGFVFAAALVGLLAERRWDRGPWVHVAMLAGTLLIYVPGLIWLGYLISIDWVAPGGSVPIGEVIAGSDTLDKTLRGGLYPFIAGDLMKVFAAAAVLPSAWLLVDRLKGRRDP